MQIESCGLSNAHSGAGAMGLFQVMPFHFGPGEDPFDPETNAHRGLNYLQEAYKLADGDVAKTLAGYNGGHSSIFVEPEQWAVETKRYVYWGVGILEDITLNKESSPTLETWLNAGGHNLCQRALLANLP